MTDIARKRGDTYAEEWVVIDPATGAVVDITGASFRLTVDRRQEPADATTKLFHADGQIVAPASNGRVRFPLTGPQADNVGAFFFDVQMTAADGGIRTLDSGTWTVSQDITK